MEPAQFVLLINPNLAPSVGPHRRGGGRKSYTLRASFCSLFIKNYKPTSVSCICTDANDVNNHLGIKYPICPQNYSHSCFQSKLQPNTRSLLFFWEGCWNFGGPLQSYKSRGVSVTIRSLKTLHQMLPPDAAPAFHTFVTSRAPHFSSSVAFCNKWLR